jgi:ribosomal protein L29
MKLQESLKKMLKEHSNWPEQNYQWEQLLSKEEQMPKKKGKDYKSMNQESLKKELLAQRKLLFESNFKHKMGQLKESHLLRETRKNIARIKTEIETNGG